MTQKHLQACDESQLAPQVQAHSLFGPAAWPLQPSLQAGSDWGVRLAIRALPTAVVGKAAPMKGRRNGSSERGGWTNDSEKQQSTAAGRDLLRVAGTEEEGNCSKLPLGVAWYRV